MKLLRSLILLALTCLYHIHALPEPQLNEESKYGDFHPSDIITRDVAIIGGGSGGTYTAIRLRQLGKSVVVVVSSALDLPLYSTIYCMR
jgi:NADPH-dependent 2,4-dienoyl-CoA reductase/sulfur reductase-like enzyme